MRFTRNLITLAVMAAAMTGFVHAQDAKAKFTLPHATMLGETLLPAGTYVVQLSFDGFTKALIAPEDHSSKSIYAVPLVTDAYATCAKSTVTISRASGEWDLRSICFADSQLAVHFAASSPKTALATATPAPMSLAGSK